jgi:flagellar biosynthesis protein FliQ
VKARKILIRATTIWLLLLVGSLAMIFTLLVGLFVAWFTLGTR